MIEKNIIELFSCRTAAAYYSFSEAYFRKPTVRINRIKKDWLFNTNE